MDPIYLMLTALFFLVLVLLMPKLVELRIRVLRFLHLRWLANWHERHFVGFVLSMRLLLGAVAVFLIVYGLAQ